MKSCNILIVEDNEMYSSLVSKSLEHPEIRITVSSDATTFFNNFDDEADIVILDYMLPDMKGVDVLAEIRKIKPEIHVLILSGQEDIGALPKLFELGVTAYIVKGPGALTELKERVEELLPKIKEQKKSLNINREIVNREKYHEILGHHPSTLNVLKLIQRVEQTDVGVLIHGASGTGKELVARAIHMHSNRKKKPFIAVNIAAIPNTLMEDELFGHEKGAFTGETGRRKGKFEEAQGGTIFLDEIGEMELSMQSKLLRVLQERKVTRLGSNKEISLNVRVIAASHRNLLERVKEGYFREDLYYRIQGFPITLPCLKDRGDDVLVLANAFLSNYSRANGTPAKYFSAAASELLLKHSWPGNIRELKTFAERCSLLAETEVVSSGDIAFFTQSSIEELKDKNALSTTTKEQAEVNQDLLTSLSEMPHIMPFLKAINDVLASKLA